MKYTCWLCTLCILLISCKSDANKTNNNPVEKDDEPRDSIQLSGTKDSLQNDVKIITDKQEEEIDDSGSDIKDHTKSVPKTEVQPATDKIEGVETTDNSDKSDETTDNETSTPPRPEKTSTKGEVEQVETKEVINNPIVREQAFSQDDHSIFDELLKNNVSEEGKVNYKNLKSSIGKLNSYLEQLEQIKASDLTNLRKLAFWINAYNAYTLKLILDNYPVKQITDLHGGKPWDRKWIKLDGRTLSLNNIENDIIRPKFKDARIHFAVNCAAKSCPPLLNRAYTGNNIESFLEKQTRKFINNRKFNQFSPKAIKISKIFEWYSSDFGDLRAFLSRYSESAISDDAKISYSAYDWALNE